MLFQKYGRAGSLTRLLNSHQLWTARAPHKLESGRCQKNYAEESDHRWIPRITTFKTDKTFSMLFQTYARGAVILGFWMYVSFELQEHLNNLNVAFVRRPMQRSITIAEYQEWERSKQNTQSVWLFKNMLDLAVLLVFRVNTRLVHHQVILHQLNVAIFRSFKNTVLAGNPSGGSCLKQKWMGESQQQLRCAVDKGRRARLGFFKGRGWSRSRSWCCR